MNIFKVSPKMHMYVLLQISLILVFFVFIPKHLKLFFLNYLTNGIIKLLKYKAKYCLYFFFMIILLHAIQEKLPKVEPWTPLLIYLRREFFNMIFPLRIPKGRTSETFGSETLWFYLRVKIADVTYMDLHARHFYHWSLCLVFV